MTDQAAVKFKCSTCGEQITWDEDAEDDQAVACSACGKAIGTLGELKALALQKTAEHAVDMTRAALKPTLDRWKR